MGIFVCFSFESFSRGFFAYSNIMTDDYSHWLISHFFVQFLLKMSILSRDSSLFLEWHTVPSNSTVYLSSSYAVSSSFFLFHVCAIHSHSPSFLFIRRNWKNPFKIQFSSQKSKFSPKNGLFIKHQLTRRNETKQFWFIILTFLLIYLYCCTKRTKSNQVFYLNNICYDQICR